MLTRTHALLIFATAALVSCSEFEQPNPRRDRLHFPIGLALHPDGSALYVVNSNFDGRYSADQGGSVAVIDTDTLSLRAPSSVFIPSFGSTIVLNEDASRAYISAREGDSLVLLDIDSADPFDIGCGSGPSTTACVFREESGAPAETELEPARLPADPFGLDIARVARDGRLFDVLGIAHLRSSAVSAMTIPVDGTAAQARSAAEVAVGPLFRSNGSSNAVVRRPGTLEFYATGRTDNVISAFSPFINVAGEVEAIVDLRRDIVLSNSLTQVDARAAAFNAAGDRFFTVTRTPDSFYVFRVTAEDREQGQGVRFERVAETSTVLDPSDVIPHIAPDGQRLVYVLGENRQGQGVIFVYDENAALVDDIVFEFGAIPTDMVIEQCSPGALCRAFVSLFTDSVRSFEVCDNSEEGCGSIAVLDLDPSSSGYHSIISKIR
ncbi:MAG: hypothetical protein AAGI01_16195 [Myxococcota bacterium]